MIRYFFTHAPMLVNDITCKAKPTRGSSHCLAQCLVFGRCGRAFPRQFARHECLVVDRPRLLEIGLFTGTFPPDVIQAEHADKVRASAWFR